jgi:hypothetical protein
VCYSEGFVAEILKILKKARKIAPDNNMDAGTLQKEVHDIKVFGSLVKN